VGKNSAPPTRSRLLPHGDRQPPERDRPTKGRAAESRAALIKTRPGQPRGPRRARILRHSADRVLAILWKILQAEPREGPVTARTRTGLGRSSQASARRGNQPSLFFFFFFFFFSLVGPCPPAEETVGVRHSRARSQGIRAGRDVVTLAKQHRRNSCGSDAGIGSLAGNRAEAGAYRGMRPGALA